MSDDFDDPSYRDTLKKAAKDLEAWLDANRRIYFGVDHVKSALRKINRHLMDIE